jgi:hypothetical protein
MHPMVKGPYDPSLSLTCTAPIPLAEVFENSIVAAMGCSKTFDMPQNPIFKLLLLIELPIAYG